MNKILIVEDDAIVARIYESRLEKEGYEVEICADGQSGFYRIHEFRPDAVLLDLMLPKMNGIEILKKIRAQAEIQRTPVIVFTNAYVPNMIHEATLTPRQVIEALRMAIQAGASQSHAATPTPKADASAASSEEPSAGPATEPAPRAAAASADSGTPAPKEKNRRLDSSEDAAFQAELLQEFLAGSEETLALLRRHMQEFTKAQDDSKRLPHLMELYRRVHALTGSAGLAGLCSISQMAAALEVLLKDLLEKPKNINASTMRTVANALDFVGELLAKGIDAAKEEAPVGSVLVVDDEILSRRAITYALEKADLKSVSVEDPQVALKLVSENTFSLIFLDVQMPGMDGFELCTKIRGLPANKLTPVVFVTSLTDFKSRAKSSLSGGNDLIAKPFMFIELSVKALTYVMRGRLVNPQRAAA
jgi:DNA-binding response OmpR family regulator